MKIEGQIVFEKGVGHPRLMITELTIIVQILLSLHGVNKRRYNSLQILDAFTLCMQNSNRLVCVTLSG